MWLGTSKCLCVCLPGFVLFSSVFDLSFISLNCSFLFLPLWARCWIDLELPYGVHSCHVLQYSVPEGPSDNDPFFGALWQGKCKTSIDSEIPLWVSCLLKCNSGNKPFNVASETVTMDTFMCMCGSSIHYSVFLFNMPLSYHNLPSLVEKRVKRYHLYKLISNTYLKQQIHFEMNPLELLTRHFLD